ncbi:hypothetical protein GIY56_00635 [Paracoccus sp. YIM 132242]|uniref:Uncharacterized protein n=1 Tax=Paracoccus lichenicola TaxID=2665644 RepID=A0A6L6HKL5_9RHOB|nr:hypothetical protein [Paracoccus lichenicola]MTD98789.1 hypothetical protein [Paracoccus lichenicola]
MESPLVSSALSYPIRQRLTALGWWGLILMLIMPMIFGYAYMEYVSDSAKAAYSYANGYTYSAESAEKSALTKGVIALISAILATLGMIGVFIGREHYQYIPKTN